DAHTATNKTHQPEAPRTASSTPTAAAPNGANATTLGLKGGRGTAGNPGSCTATGVALLISSRTVGSARIVKIARPVAAQIHAASSGRRARYPPATATSIT